MIITSFWGWHDKDDKHMQKQPNVWSWTWERLVCQYWQHLLDWYSRIYLHSNRVVVITGQLEINEPLSTCKIVMVT